MINKSQDAQLNDYVNIYKATDLLKNKIDKESSKIEDVSDKIQDIYKEIKKRENSLDSDIVYVKDLKEDLQDSFVDIEEKLDDLISKVEKQQKTINELSKNCDEINDNLDSYIEDTTNRLDELEQDYSALSFNLYNYINEKEDTKEVMDNTNEKTLTLEDVLKTAKDNTWKSIRYWYENQDDTYLLLTRKNYSKNNDYCIFVESITNKYARGMFFQNGQFKNNLSPTALSIDAEEYKPYTGKSLDKIIDYLDNLNEL